MIQSAATASQRKPMEPPLTTYQRQLGEHRIMFDHLLASDLEEALRRASLACAENGKKETGLIEFFCGLYLHYSKEVSDYFSGDFDVVLTRIFPKHRFGVEGLVPDAILEKAANDDESGGFFYSVTHSDEVLRLLWLAMALANAVGKRASLKDTIAALGQDMGWTSQLSREGLTLAHKVANFDSDIGTVVFHADSHMNAAWPRRLEFQHDGTVKPPFTLAVKTPSGGFQPVRTARIKLNGNTVADIVWPATAIVNAAVELKASNSIDLELDGPAFGSIEFTIRGASRTIK
jgi:hypothetical protein